MFEPAELETAAYTGGRLIWQRPSYENKDSGEGNPPLPSTRESSLDHAVGEALTNLYVGLGRYMRGEKLSAFLFIQRYPIDRLLSILHLLEPEVDFFPDVFGNERRVELRYPQFSGNLGGMLQGYDRTPESALKLLDYLELIYPVNSRMSQEIRALAARCMHREQRLCYHEWDQL
ncbi:hypothetical protein [Cohnella boryungensis]|uniref:Uncharacterized protein n=1 Tax=Cohnella boryungensis TaxID=768479 RepID=A0ABV8SJG9_9BACL